MHAAGVPAAGLEKLAAADCFRSLGLDRRAALWEVKALSRSDPLPLFAFAQALEQGAEPSVAITIDGLQFTRLAGGRPLLPERPQSIDYAGDTEAGARIVENLAYVI